MPLSYVKNKKHIYAWVEKNKERKNEITLKCMRKKRMFENECKRLSKIIY